MEREVTLLTENQESPSIALYTAEDNSIQLDVKLENETVWLSQQQMVILFGRDKSVISRHIKNIFEEGELDRPLVVANFATPKKYGRHKDREQIQHTFSDGNKRIAAMLFLWFMDRNRVLYAADGHKRIADNTLVALTLMIAESRPEEKDIIIKLVVNLINQNNQ